MGYWASHSEELDKQAYYDYKCQECGEPFRAYGCAKRKYCSRHCYGLAKRRHHLQGTKSNPPSPSAVVRSAAKTGSVTTQTSQAASKPDKGAIMAVMDGAIQNSDPTLPPWEKVLQLHENGISCKTISKALKISYNTVKSWLRRYDITIPKSTGSKCMLAMKYSHEGESASTVRKWQPIKTMSDWSNYVSQASQGFQCADNETVTNGRPVILVCGAVAASKGADILSTLIRATLRKDPFRGDIYAFCGRSRDRIKMIHWDGSGFCIVSRRKEHGAYFWPPQRLGQTITVSAREFEYLLRGCESR